jgi:hypothetical protein
MPLQPAALRRTGSQNTKAPFSSPTKVRSARAAADRDGSKAWHTHSSLPPLLTAAHGDEIPSPLRGRYARRGRRLSARVARVRSLAHRSPFLLSSKRNWHPSFDLGVLVFFSRFPFRCGSELGRRRGGLQIAS